MNRQEEFREQFCGFEIDIKYRGKEGRGLIIKEDRYYIVSDLSTIDGDKPKNLYGYSRHRAINNNDLSSVSILEPISPTLAKNWTIIISEEDYKKYTGTQIAKDFIKWYRDIRNITLSFVNGDWCHNSFDGHKEENYIYTFEQWKWWYENYFNKTNTSMIKRKFSLGDKVRINKEGIYYRGTDRLQLQEGVIAKVIDTENGGDCPYRVEWEGRKNVYREKDLELVEQEETSLSPTLPDNFLLYPIYKNDVDRLIKFNSEFEHYGLSKGGEKKYKHAHTINITKGKLNSYGTKSAYIKMTTISSTEYLEIVNKKSNGLSCNTVIVDEGQTIPTNQKSPTKEEEKIIELEERLTKSRQIFTEQEGKIKELNTKLSILEAIDIEKEKKEAIEVYKKNLLKIGKLKTISGRHKAWDDVIIEALTYKKLLLAWEKKLPMLLSGPAGCGKSSMIKALVEEKGSALVQYNFNGETTVEHLLGHKILINGTMSWEDGPLTDAVRNGKTFLADEINATSPEVQYILNGLLENKKGELGSLSVQGNNGEVIKAHPNFRFFGTYNPNYLGTNHFSGSIMSRFIGANISPLRDVEEKALLCKFFPTLRVEIDILVDKAVKLRNNRDFNYDLSTRDIIQTLYFVDGGFSIIDAVDATIINSLQIDLEQKICREEFNS